VTDYLIRNASVLGGTPTDLGIKDGLIVAADEVPGAEIGRAHV